MHYFVRKPWDLSQSDHTPIEVYKNRKFHRREFLKSMGLAAGAGLAGTLAGCTRADEDEVAKAGAVEPLPKEIGSVYPAKRNLSFEYGRPETAKRDAAEYCNFYEFCGGKNVWEFVQDFKPSPWSFEIDGLCAQPRTFDMDDVYKSFTFEERAYRHRCVEAWAMCIPWTGFRLSELLKLVEPKPAAKYVAFETFNRPDEAQFMARRPADPWPYTEGLTIDEAMNELAFIATGIYGEQLPKQHGAPIRLIVPWKYGFKCIKSFVKIMLTDKQPSTYWNTLMPHEYDFQANVNPEIAHPRWSQRSERMLGTQKRYETVKYNGYGDYVGDLYS